MRGATKRRKDRRKKVNKIPGSEFIAVSGKAPLIDRLVKTLGIPEDIGEVITTASYNYNGNIIFLFRDDTNFQGFDKEPEFHQLANKTEIQEIVGVWDYMVEEHGKENAGGNFITYIERLILNQKKKATTDQLVNDDIVFESPYLAEIRRQEQLKTQLLGRKRRPIKGIKCPKCKSNEGWLEEAQTRSGDEGSSFEYICATCDHRWWKK